MDGRGFRDVGFKFLVISDGSGNVDGLRDELRFAGYDAVLQWVDSKETLRETLRENVFDLVLCDDLNTGVDIVSARGIIAESGQDMPFIVISGDMTPEAQQIASQMKAGVYDFIEWGKPERLIPAVERALQSSKAQRQNRIAEREMRYRANFDSLTDLPNRALMLDRLSQAIKKARRDDSGVLLMFLDLDRFKVVNDSLGHLAGDLLLRKAAKRISACLRDTDTAARIGGDEFVIVLPDTRQTDIAKSISGKLLNAFSRPFELDSKPASVTASIGITVFPDDGEDPETLLKNADTAMYEAKEMGRNAFCVYSAIDSLADRETPVVRPANVVALREPAFSSATLKLGLALAAGLALAVFASSFMTSLSTKESLRIAIEDGMETMSDFSTASGPD